MSDRAQRLVLTLFVLVCLVALSTVPIPGLDREVVQRLSQYSGLLSSGLTLAAIGVIPWLSATVIVDVVTRIAPALRPLRHHAEGRHRMNRWVRVLWLVLAASQAWLNALSFEQMRLDGMALVLAPGGLFRLQTALTLVAGSALVGALCHWNARRGLGGGYLVALLPMPIVDLQLWFMTIQIGDVTLMTPVLIVAAGALLLALRTPAGVLPLSVAGFVPLAMAMEIGGFWTDPAQLYALIVLATLVLGVLANHPVAVARVSGRPETVVRRDLALGLVLNGALLCGLWWGVLSAGNPGFGIGLLLALALGWDLVEEFRARARGPLAVAWQLDRVHTVDPVLEKLQSVGIEASSRGRRTRSLLHDLGGFVPLDVLVPPERVADARRVVQAALGGAPPPDLSDPPPSEAPRGPLPEPPPSRSPWDAPADV